MVHYSGVSIIDFEQVNIGWDLPGSFQKLESRKNLEKSHAWPFKRLSPTRKIFKGDHWILPKLKQQTNHNKSFIFLMAHIALRYIVKTRFANSFHLALIHAYRWRYVSLKYMPNILLSLWTRITYAFFRRNLSLDTLAVTKICTKFLLR